jgi:hypothetical protein
MGQAACEREPYILSDSLMRRVRRFLAILTALPFSSARSGAHDAPTLKLRYVVIVEPTNRSPNDLVVSAQQLVDATHGFPGEIEVDYAPLRDSLKVCNRFPHAAACDLVRIRAEPMSGRARPTMEFYIEIHKSPDPLGGHVSLVPMDLYPCQRTQFTEQSRPCLAGAAAALADAMRQHFADRTFLHTR